MWCFPQPKPQPTLRCGSYQVEVYELVADLTYLVGGVVELYFESAAATLIKGGAVLCIGHDGVVDADGTPARSHFYCHHEERYNESVGKWVGKVVSRLVGWWGN